MKRALIIKFGLVLGSACTAGFANALIAYTDLGPGDSFHNGAGEDVDGAKNPTTQLYQDVEWQFSSLVSGTLGEIDLGLYRISGTDGVTVKLLTNKVSFGADYSDQVLGSWTLTGLPSGSTGLSAPPMSLITGGSIQISQGTKYWVLVQPKNDDLHAIWCNNDQNVQTLGRYSRDQQIYTPLAGPTGAFRVQTLPLVPEPGSLAVIGLGLAALVRRRVSRR